MFAGRDCFLSFMVRNPTMSIRKAENVSIRRANVMNREDMNTFFEIL